MRQGGGKLCVTMKKKARSSKFAAKQSARLSAYFAAGVGASMLATANSDAAIQVNNIGPGGFNIAGINGGVASGSFTSINNFPAAGEGTLNLYNNLYDGEQGRVYLGISGGWYNASMQFASGVGYATPTKFALNQSIDGSAYFPTFGSNVLFYFNAGGFGTYTSPDFGSGSYMGFKTASGNYGWLEVTWDSSAKQFEILGGAYQDEVGVAILAGQGAGPAAVPEPGTWAAAALLAGGAAFARWRKRRDESLEAAA